MSNRDKGGTVSTDHWPKPGEAAVPFPVLIAGGYPCRSCGVLITPGATGYRCGDGEIRCAEHQGAVTSWPTGKLETEEGT